MSALKIMREIRRKLERVFEAADLRIVAEIARRRRLAAFQLARCISYDMATIERVLEIGLEIDLEDPEKFLRHCSATGLDPVETISAIRRIQRAG